MIVVVVASMILAATCSFALFSRGQRAWGRRRAVRREAAHGIARLELMLQEREDQAVRPPKRGEGDTGSGKSASNPQIS